MFLCKKNEGISTKTLDIILPVYNPPKGWVTELEYYYKRFINSLPSDVQPKLIVVNDGSSENLDKDLLALENNILNTACISYEVNRGKGYALRKAFAISRSQYSMFTDYDFPYQAESMTALVNKLLTEDYDAVVGIRESSYYNVLSQKRRKISKLLKSLNKFVLRLPTNDTQCGLKAFNAKGREIILKTKTDRYLIDLEILKKMTKAGLNIETHVVFVRQQIQASKISNLNLLRELGSFIRILLFS